MNHSSLTVFFLCAGYGSRLHPLTEKTPKPLIPFKGKSALEWNIEKVIKLNPTQIIMNTHHLPQAFKAVSEKYGIQVFNEPEILGTGGSLGCLKDVLSKTDYFLIHNGDVLHTFDLQEFYQRGREQGTFASLIGIDLPKVNSLTFDSLHHLQGIHGYNGFKAVVQSQRLTYSGVALYHRDFLNYCESENSDIKSSWIKALNDSQKIEVVDYSQKHWFDFGTHEDLKKTTEWMEREHKVKA